MGEGSIDFTTSMTDTKLSGAKHPIASQSMLCRRRSNAHNKTFSFLQEKCIAIH
jgi:hypothetical protein